MAAATSPPTVVILLALLSLFSVGHGTNSNNNGHLTLDNVPSDHVYVVSGEYDEGTFPLPTTWGLVDSFLHTVSPAPPPYALINSFIAGEPISIEALTSSITQFTGNLLGFAICFILGALFCVIFPIVCMCFCCCRCCCGNCGGKKYQKKRGSDRMKRVIFGFCLAVCLGFIVGGVGTAFTVNTFAGEKAQTLPTEVIGSLDDMVSYVNNTLQEIDFVIDDQLTYTLAQVTQDLLAIDQLVGVPVQQNLAVNVQPALDAIYPLATSISDTYDALLAVNTTQASVETMWSAVEALVDQSLVDINAACVTCSCCSGGSYPNVLGLSMLADWRDIDLVNIHGTFPQVVLDTSITEIESVNNQNLAQAADKGKATFDNIPETLKNTTLAEIASIVANLDSLDNIPGLLDDVTSQLGGFTDIVEELKLSINSFIPLIQEYDPYRSYALIGFYSILLVIALLFVFGLVLGVAGYNSEVSPSQRGAASNCGGIFMMVGVYVAFFFLTFFMLFTMLLFVTGGPVDRLVCDPVISGELWEETIDKEDAIGDGYFLGKNLFNDGNISLTLTGILDDCQNNRAAFVAFKLNNFLSITGLLDFNQFVPNIGSQFDSVIGDLTNVDILTAETEQILTDFRDSEADTIDWTLFKAELAKDLTNNVNDPNDLSVIAVLLSTFAGTLSGIDATTFQTLATDLDEIQTNSIAPLLTLRDTLLSNIASLETLTAGIDTLVNNTLEAANTAQTYLDTNSATFISQQITTYEARILGYPDTFVTYALNQIETKIGMCRPVYNFYSTSTNIFCRGVLESLNALWFIMGWCIFFLLPSTIFGVKLAKHYRRMDYDDYNGDEMEMEMEMETGLRNNKVAPSYA